MNGDAQAIVYRQARRKNEPKAIHQQFVHSRMLKHWGLERPAKKGYAQSIGQMKHADGPLDRIFSAYGLARRIEPPPLALNGAPPPDSRLRGGCFMWKTELAVEGLLPKMSQATRPSVSKTLWVLEGCGTRMRNSLSHSRITRPETVT